MKGLLGGPEVTRAVAVFQPTEGNKVVGDGDLHEDR